MWRDDALLLDMLLAARRVREFTTGRTADDFAAERMLQSATQYELQIIGEAAGRISAGYQVEHSEIPWRKIIAFRHRLVHDYPPYRTAEGLGNRGTAYPTADSRSRGSRPAGQPIG